MMASIICSRCGRTIRIGNGKVNLTCQSCGEWDFRIGSPIIVSPILPDGTTGRREEFKMDDSFTGMHKDGFIWLVEIVREKKPKEEKPELLSEKEDSTIEEEVVEKKEEKKPKKEKDEIQLSFAKSMRRLRARANP